MTDSPDLRSYTKQIACRLLGQPNPSLSTKDQLRFSTNGSVSIEIAGEKAGAWYDHENGFGGGPWDLLTKKGGMANGAARDWLRSEIGVDIPSRRKYQWSPIVPVPSDVPLPDGNNLPDADGKWPRAGMAFPPHELGKPTQVYWFHDRDGVVVCGECRFEIAPDTPNEAGLSAKPEKTYRPLTFCRRDDSKVSEWRWKAPPKPYPLFNLPQLMGDRDKTLLVFEGARKAVRAADLFWDHIPIAALFGGKSPNLTDWTPVAGWRLQIWPDHDETGASFGETVARLATAAGALSISIVKVPANWPKKWDIADSIPDGGGPEVLEALLNSAQPWSPPPELPDFHPRASSNFEGERQLGRVITVKPGERHKAADEGICALFDTGVAFFQRDRKLCRVVNLTAKSSNGDTILVPGIAALTPAILDRALGQAAIWQRQGKDTAIQIDPPNLVGAQIIDMVGEWPFPALAGITGCPTLRPDGSVLSAEGYDPATGLVLKSAVAMPPLPDHPTRVDAEQALQLLFELLAEFPFADEESKSVALSMVLTPVLRGAMSAAPMHLVIAPQPGTGKSYLADVASMIATGERVAVVAVSPKLEETEKRLIGCALAGSPIIGLDNCRGMLEGDFLCQVTERPMLQLRPLGKSDIIRVPNTFTTFANGNNVGVADDLVRRTINCALDANVEDPETRAFRGDPLAAIRRNRGAYVAACLTIARAYLVAGKPDRLPPLPSYQAWSDLVRSPLVWLSRADPVLTMAAARDADPIRRERARVFDAWSNDLGSHSSHPAPQLIELAVEWRYFEEERISRAVRPALHAALLEIAEKRGAPGQIDPVRLGLWLTRNANTIVDNFKLIVDRADSRRVRYGLRKVQKA